MASAEDMIATPIPLIIAPLLGNIIICKNPPRVASKNPQIEPNTRIPMATPINDEIALVVNNVNPPAVIALVPITKINRKIISGLNFSRDKQIHPTSASKFILKRFSNWKGFLDRRDIKKYIKIELK